MAAGVRIKKSALAKALRRNGGILAAAARDMGVARFSVIRCVERWPELRAIIEEAKEDLCDEAEVSIRELVRDRNVAATIFILKTLGKARGYAQRYEVTGADGGPVNVADLTKLTDDEVAAIAGRPLAGGGGTGTA
jgi:hypothetical protein